MVHRSREAAAGGALVLLLALGAAQSRQGPTIVTVAVLVGLAGAAALAARQLSRWQRLGASAVTAAAVGVLCTGHSGNPGWFAFCLLVWWSAMLAGAAPATWLAGAMVAALAVEWIVRADDAGWANWIAGTLFTLVVTLLARRQGELLEELRAAQAGLADRARAEERNRIARELHDVIGHALTVSLLHVTSARLALADDPDDAVASLAEAERLAQRSLAEVRRAVGLMRDDDAQVTPLPGVDDVEALVVSVRRAGTPVALEVVGRPDGLPATSGLTIYRVVQEALTNVARHAPGAATTVRVEYGERTTRLTVDSAGARPGGTRGGVTPDGGVAPEGADAGAPGLGLVGMRERVEVVGGRLRAGPAGSGWLVEAELPR